MGRARFFAFKNMAAWVVLLAVLSFSAAEGTAYPQGALPYILPALPLQVNLILFRDPSTSPGEWEAMTSRFAADVQALKADGRKILFAGDARYKSLEAFVASRSELRKISKASVLQFVDPREISRDVRPYAEKIIGGAIPLAQGRIVVAGSRDSLPGTRHFTAAEILESTFEALLAVRQSA